MLILSFLQQEWIHRYELCGEYMKKLNPADIIQFIDGVVFVENSLDMVMLYIQKYTFVQLAPLYQVPCT